MILTGKNEKNYDFRAQELALHAHLSYPLNMLRIYKARLVHDMKNPPLLFAPIEKNLTKAPDRTAQKYFQVGIPQIDTISIPPHLQHLWSAVEVPLGTEVRLPQPSISPGIMLHASSSPVCVPAKYHSPTADREPHMQS